MSHSNQIREFLMSSGGIQLVDAYIGAAGVLTGTARVVQEAHERAEARRRAEENALRLRDLTRRRMALDRQLEEVRASLEAAEDEEARLRADTASRTAIEEDERRELIARRRAAE